MSKFQRINNIIMGVLMILCGLLLISDIDDGYKLVILLVEISLFIDAIKNIVYYFTMARHMVDGRKMLYRGVFSLDLALFAWAIMDVPGFMIVIYIDVVIGFMGGVTVFKAFQERKLGHEIWKKDMLKGALILIIFLAMIPMAKSVRTCVILYAIGIIASGIRHIIKAIKKPQLIIIQ